MFCQKCGAQLPDGTPVCSACNTAQTQSPQPAYRPPNFETKTVQCYPSEYEERKTVEFYQRCGWQVVSSNRNQERHGDTISTFIRITIQRDRNMPNYEKIRELSSKAEGRFEKVSKTKSTGIPVGMIIGGAVFLFLAMIIISSGIGCMVTSPGIENLMILIIGTIFLAGGLVLLLIGIRRVRRAKAYNLEAKKRDRDRDAEIEAIVAECEKLVRGQA